MRKSVWLSKVCVVLILLAVTRSARISALGGWGLVVGRANDEDRARLLVDQLIMKMSQDRISGALSRELGR